MKIKDKITLEIGGTLFTTTKRSLSRFSGSRLSQLDENDESFDPSTGHYFFDRNPELFNWILDAYRYELDLFVFLSPIVFVTPLKLQLIIYEEKLVITRLPTKSLNPSLKMRNKLIGNDFCFCPGEVQFTFPTTCALHT